MARPVSLKGRPHVQVTTLTARQSSSANYAVDGSEAAATLGVLDGLLSQQGIGSVQLRSMDREVNVQVGDSRCRLHALALFTCV